MVSLKHYDRKANTPVRFDEERTWENTKVFNEIPTIRHKIF